MSRSGYSDDLDNNWALIKWRGQVTSAIRGKRGQALLRETLAALDAMPVKRLVANEFEAAGEFCTLGVVGKARGLDLAKLDPDDAWGTAETLGKQFDVAAQLAQEIMWLNDEGCTLMEVEGKWVRETPEHRWQRMRNWVASQIKPQGKDTKD